MAVIYSEFDTTVANAAADIKTKILTSTDWASLTGTGLTTAVKATTPRGAQMVVDFADVAITSVRMAMAVYRTHDGTTAVDKVTRFMQWRDSGGATTDTLHVVVSAGPQHLYVSIEGPRAGETNANTAATGSHKQSLYIGDITPYFGGDTIPAVALIAAIAASATTAGDYVYVSRNAADTSSWVPGYVATLCNPGCNGNSSRQPTVLAAGDGNEYLYPWVVVEQSAGIRGRLTNCFYGGMSPGDFLVSGDQGLSAGSKVSYSSQNYIAQVPFYYRSGNNSGIIYPWFRISTGGGNQQDGPLLMIPST